MILDQFKAIVAAQEGDPIVNLATLVAKQPIEIELTLAEIAYCTGITANTLKRIEDQAIRKLRKYAKDLYKQ